MCDILRIICTEMTQLMVRPLPPSAANASLTVCEAHVSRCD